MKNDEEIKKIVESVRKFSDKLCIPTIKVGNGLKFYLDNGKIFNLVFLNDVINLIMPDVQDVNVPEHMEPSEISGIKLLCAGIFQTKKGDKK